MIGHVKSIRNAFLISFICIYIYNAIRLYFLTQNSLSTTNDKLQLMRVFDVSSHETSIHNNPDYWWRGQGHALFQTNASINVSVMDKTKTHLGARHPNGTVGMIVNPSTQRLKPINYNDYLLYHEKDICTSGTNVGSEGVGGHKVLEKIKHGIHASSTFLNYQQQAIRNLTTTTIISSNLTATVPVIGLHNTIMTARAKRSRILCLIYTVHFPPNYDNPNLKAQAETWGAECDGFIAASNYTDHATGSIDLTHNGDESYSNMWQKVRSMWAYVYDHYLEEYDYFHIGGDDTYVVVENLRAYINGPEVIRLEDGYQDAFASKTTPPWIPQVMGPRPLLLGSPFLFRDKLIVDGGPGYTLNRAAVELLVEKHLPSFLPDAVDSREDVFVASILNISNTRDSNQSRRYGGSAETMFHSTVDHPGPGPQLPGRVAKMYNFSLDGPNSVSEQFIAFHLKDDKMMLRKMNLTIADQIYRYHAFFHDWCNKSSLV